jgi:hypothetical protein
MATTTSKTTLVVSKFAENVNSDTEYTAKELSKILESVYKEVYSNRKRSSNATGEKKPPSAYNLFIKSEIEKIKSEKIQGVDPKDYMKIAAQRWKENKEKQ